MEYRTWCENGDLLGYAEGKRNHGWSNVDRYGSSYINTLNFRSDSDAQKAGREWAEELLATALKWEDENLPEDERNPDAYSIQECESSKD